MSNPKSATTAEWLERWIEEIYDSNQEARHSGSIRRCANRYEYQGLIREYLSPLIGSVGLASLTIDDLIGTYQEIYRSAGQRNFEDGLATARMAHRLMAEALHDAVRHGLLESNPAAADGQ